MDNWDKAKIAISILKYSPREAAQELYYPTSDQNRINRNLPEITDIFDYTSEQRQRAADFLTELLKEELNSSSKSYSYFTLETIRLWMQLNLPYPELRKALAEFWLRESGF